MRDVWASGEAYEQFMGRWSRRVAARFVSWLDADAGAIWLDVGCGTGALGGAVLAATDPDRVVGLDPSPGFVHATRAALPDQRLGVVRGAAGSLPFADDSFHATVSGLVLNFVPDPAAAVAEMARVTRGGGTVAAYVWDYAAGMGMLRHFWDAARVVDPRAAELDEGQRFALCSPEALGALWRRAGLDPVSVDALDVPTEFAGFDDYWGPFLGGQGPAPGYLMSLPHARRDGIERELRAQLPLQTDGRIVLGARAWAVRGRTPNGGVALTDAD